MKLENLIKELKKENTLFVIQTSDELILDGYISLKRLKEIIEK